MEKTYSTRFPLRKSHHFWNKMETSYFTDFSNNETIKEMKVI